MGGGSAGEEYAARGGPKTKAGPAGPAVISQIFDTDTGYFLSIFSIPLSLLVSFFILDFFFEVLFIASILSVVEGAAALV